MPICGGGYGSTQFVMAMLQTGITWVPSAELLQSDRHGAAEHVASNFARWIHSVVTSITEHKEHTEQYRAADETPRGRPAVKRRKHGGASPSATLIATPPLLPHKARPAAPPHRGEAQAAGSTEHNRARGPEQTDKSAVPFQAAETEARWSSGRPAAQTVVQPAALQRPPPPTAAQAPAASPAAPRVGVIPRTPEPSGRQGTANREESWRLEMLGAINQMRLMLNLQETSLFRMARAAQRRPHGP